MRQLTTPFSGSLESIIHQEKSRMSRSVFVTGGPVQRFWGA
jgi:hypothetical protein